MENQEEIWKDVVGYEGFYQVSSIGRVKSLKRERIFTKGVICERILKLLIGKNGGVRVTLYNNKGRQQKEVHQLVAIAFLNHKPCGFSLVVNHIDFNRQNNHQNNLEVITQRQNTNRKHIKSTSKYVGVSYMKSKQKWRSQIRINGKQKHLGLFINELDAFKAYQKELLLIKNHKT
jgi:hypothetical protein